MPPNLPRLRTVSTAVLVLVLGTSIHAACAGGTSEPRSTAAEPVSPPVAPSAAPTAAPPMDAGAEETTISDAASGPPPECPPDMLHVRHDFCPEMQRRCMKSEYDKSNHITICHRFAPDAQQCLKPRISLNFCIDRYEFPNQKGARPPVLVDWYTAMGKCAALGKRLCYESEWVAACEGPDETPFPYGWERSKDKCNIDNPWIEPSLKKIYSRDPAVSQAELRRLDQSVPSGAMEGCVSGYGVHDLTGNFDEWALADRDRPEERAVFVALKGGAWGHVRNACRPVTTSHDPLFTYYFVSFRCCQDAASMPEFGERPTSDATPAP